MKHPDDKQGAPRLPYVLMDGHGRRYSGPALSREDAVGLWVAAFLNWNCERPGLYRLCFAYVEG